MISRDRIERGFDTWTRQVFRRRWQVIGASLALGLAMGSGVSRLSIDLTFEAFLHPDDPARVAYDAFRDVFGRGDAAVIGIDPPDVFDPEFLDRLRTFHGDIEREVPHVDEVTSLINARSTRGVGDELIVGDLLEEWPSDAAAFTELRDRVLSNPLYANSLISEDGGFTTVMVELDTYSRAGEPVDELDAFEQTDEPRDLRFLSGDETSEAVIALHRVASRYDAPDFRIHVAGQPVLLHEVATSLQGDMQRFVAVSILMIAVFLFAIFRRIIAVIVPLVVVVLSLVSTLGLMGWTDAAIHVPTQILPSFLLAVGIGDSVHILAIYYRQLSSGASREDALAFALAHSGLAIVLTSLTTAAGLLSFSVVPLPPVAALGTFAPVGVMLALAYSTTLLPALIAVAPTRAFPPGREEGPDRMGRVLAGLGDLGTGRPWTTISIAAVLCLGAAVGTTRLRFSHDPLSWLAPDAPIRSSTLAIDRELRGSLSLEFLVQTAQVDGLQRPELLRQMEAIGQALEAEPHAGVEVGQTISLADILKEIHQALNENRPEFYRIPDDRRLIAQELLLFENSGSDDLDRAVDSQFQIGRVSLRVPWVDAIEYVPFIDAVLGLAREAIGPMAEVSVTGAIPMMAQTIDGVTRGMARSYGLALLIITPLMVLLLGNLRTGLLSMIPNLLPIILTLGLMGWCGLTIDVFTLLIGSIVIGLAVDDTIHFMHGFRRYYEASGELRAAVHETLQSVGRAMLVTTLVLAGGFLVFSLSPMQKLTEFGLLVGFAVVAAFVADVILAPALVSVAMPELRQDGPEGRELGSPPGPRR